MKPVIFVSLAEQEFTQAAVFYQSRVSGLGAAFKLAVEVAVHRVQRHPRAWPMVRPGVRRKNVARFPYGILYREHADKIVVLAVMHLHRHPDCWIGRQ
ncbi:MAG: type II toxin-antitoxin system RelE/ParE family toxin [Planctomycetes bacterium]|nr:type II toxin-antitoxin system RelE/ParE family toxin [Planctomycetota bacterium]